MTTKPPTTGQTELGNGLAVPDEPGTAVSILSKVGSVESEWEGLDDLDMAPDPAGIPVIKIGRKADGTGGIKLSGDDDTTEHIQFVWAARGLSRVKFEGEYDAAKPAKVMCRSVDGVKPDDHQPLWTTTVEHIDGDHVVSTSSEYNAPDACVACPFSFENATDRKTACRKSMEALVYLQQPGDDSGAVRVARFRFGGLAYKAAKHYWDSFRYRIPKIPAVAFVTEMTLEKEKTDNGIFYVPHFERDYQLARQEAEVFITDARGRVAQWKSVIAEDLADQIGDVAAVPETGPFDEAPSGWDPETGAEIVDAPGEEVVAQYSPSESEPF